MAVRNSLLEKFSGKFRRRWKFLFTDFPAAPHAIPCRGLGIFRQGKWLLENRPRLWERSWIFSSETATAFLSFSEKCRCKLSKGWLRNCSETKNGFFCGVLRKGRHASPYTLAFLARTPTRKRCPHSTVHECLKAFF